ncbi:MAG TPA: dihydroneopterin aldolase [Anaerolineales bacterium]|nr:dihydroneopterin aldolase [Anaerolineales bacterium]
MDKVIIRDLLVRGVIGVYEYERHIKQDILINASLYADLREAGKSDRIEECIDYEKTARLLQEHAENTARFTVEALAEDFAQVCLGIPGVESVIIRVEKPGAIRFARSVGVEIERTRSEMLTKPG